MNNYYTDSTNTGTIPIIKVAEVTDITDITKSGRIKVRIVGVDDKESDQTLIDCVPLLPKYLVTLPKLGECVLLFQYEYQLTSPTSAFKSKRFWIGPLISQPNKLEGEIYSDALSILPDGYNKLKDPNIEEGVYGNDDDIILQGRYNTDIIQKDRQIWLRTGKFIDGNPTKFNSKDIGYVQLKYGGEKLKRELIDREIVTYVEQTPEIEINVLVNTFDINGILLSDNLPKNYYTGSNISRTEYFIKVRDVKSGNIISESNDTTSYVGDNSRDSAINSIKKYVDSVKGERWRIKSRSTEVIEIYNGNNGLALFPSKSIEVKKKIKEVQLTKNNSKTTSVINVVANKINFLSHDGEHTFNLSDPKELITDEEQEKINNNAHPIVYGDILVEFLELVKKYFNSHVHPYHGLPSDPSTVKIDVLTFDLNKILNKNINSN